MPRILVVDDNANLLVMLKQTLQSEGHEVVTAMDGQKALNLFENSVFDLVITDLIMPEKEGLETILTLKTANPDLKIIAISGGGRVNADDFLIIARKLGATRTLAKPFNTQQFMAVVNSVLES